MNEIVRVTSAYNRNSQSLQFGCFGTLFSFFSIIDRDDGAIMMQGFGDLNAASRQTENDNLTSPVFFWMIHLHYNPLFK